MDLDAAVARDASLEHCENTGAGGLKEITVIHCTIPPMPELLATAAAHPHAEGVVTRSHKESNPIKQSDIVRMIKSYKCLGEEACIDALSRSLECLVRNTHNKKLRQDCLKQLKVSSAAMAGCQFKLLLQKLCGIESNGVLEEAIANAAGSQDEIVAESQCNTPENQGEIIPGSQNEIVQSSPRAGIISDDLHGIHLDIMQSSPQADILPEDLIGLMQSQAYEILPDVLLSQVHVPHESQNGTQSQAHDLISARLLERRSQNQNEVQPNFVGSQNEIHVDDSFEVVYDTPPGSPSLLENLDFMMMY